MSKKNHPNLNLNPKAERDYTRSILLDPGVPMANDMLIVEFQALLGAAGDAECG